MKLEESITKTLSEGIMTLYSTSISAGDLVIQKTRKEFEGDFTFVCFPLSKQIKQSPETIGENLGKYCTGNNPIIWNYNVVKGFLNLKLSNKAWTEFIKETWDDDRYGYEASDKDDVVVVEFSSPNTNKPLHLGHFRNNLLGDSISRILEASGRKVVRVNLVNDRGIHICKSMLAWKKWGKGETPATSGLKGDHLVGKYYVLFDKYYKDEVSKLIEGGMDVEQAQKCAPLILEAQEMLRQWEMKNPEVIDLWKTMNSWVYEGFAVTYRDMGISFDHTYYESETYLLGKKMVEEGLNKGVFSRKSDGSVWCDLTSDGLDEKILLRADGTSVYITQDIGTAQKRVDAFNPERLIYIVGNEQNYHFDVLKLVLKKLGRNWADHIFHLSYGMVELPAGKMKSREGNVVDADDLMSEMILEAEQTTRELGKIDNFSDDEKSELFRTLAMGAIKLYILKVDPKKTMLFNPHESIDFNGNTGPFIQYTHARICSLKRRVKENWGEGAISLLIEEYSYNHVEEGIIKQIYSFPEIIRQAAAEYCPSMLANFIYELSKDYNHYYQEYPVLREEDRLKAQLRLILAILTGRIIQKSLSLLGIQAPERM